MAQRIEIVDVTIASGVLKAAPTTTVLTWREGYPEFVEIRVPPGPSGLVGIQVMHSDRVIIPKEANTFLVTDDEIVLWRLEGFPYNAVYKIRAYNEGFYSHTIQFRWGINEISREQLVRAPSALPPLPVVSPGALLEGLEVG